ncbi:hypothetical protein KUTeg_010228 [Tegillarca granosa]|uniref:Uncharacterized protein n=1 Tax=Tegillarca granosa TaxID=220873 RepID=A0ABQ9FB44_TEGGR|nr:hypothetical protein KUTeg_010228 [Tegillarca granosa]
MQSHKYKKYCDDCYIVVTSKDSNIYDVNYNFYIYMFNFDSFNLFGNYMTLKHLIDLHIINVLIKLKSKKSHSGHADFKNIYNNSRSRKVAKMTCFQKIKIHRNLNYSNLYSIQVLYRLYNCISPQSVLDNPFVELMILDVMMIKVHSIYKNMIEGKSSLHFHNHLVLKIDSFSVTIFYPFIVKMSENSNRPDCCEFEINL